ncbi:MAG TPA: hypothetical protein VGG92_15365 [Caulobacteraceae bacterium]
MSLRRGLAILIAGAALVACLGVVIVAFVFAGHTLLEPWLGRPGATAAMVAAVALLIAVAAVIAQFALRPRVRPAPALPATALVDRALVFVRDRPVVSMVGAVGVGVIVIARPLFIARIARAFLERQRPAFQD